MTNKQPERELTPLEVARKQRIQENNQLANAELGITEQPETQSVSVEENWKEGFKKLMPCINPQCDNEGTIPNRVSEDEWEPEQCEYCYRERFPIREFIESTLHTHSLATEEKNERLLLCLEDREKTIREQTQYIEAIRGAAGMGFNEFHEAIATKRGITLSDSK